LRAAGDKQPPGDSEQVAAGQGKTGRPLSDQRSRLLCAIVDTVAESGFPEAKIGEIAKRAGVSRATFYELFENKQACFVEAQRQLGTSLLEITARAVRDADPERSIESAFSAIIEFAERTPAQFAFLTHEAMLGGPEALEVRDELMLTIAEQIESSQRSLPAAAPLPDVPPRMLLGGLIRVLGIRMRAGQLDATLLSKELEGWIGLFRVERGRERRWSLAGEDAGALAGRPSPNVTAPAPLPRGRHRLPPEMVERIQRERIMHAAAEVIRAKGYPSTTVTDIVAAAGVSREVFYSHFHSRADAYTATHRMIFEQLMAVTAGAFFAAGGPWPDQVWDAGAALTSFVAGAPSLAHFGFVESYALGPAIARRTDDAMIAFTVFLREGQRYRPQASSLSTTAADATVVAAIDMVAYDVRHGRTEDLFGLEPVTSYMILAPFIGAEEARAFVEEKIRRGS
jgi:AcrR family transcriptional regulator